LIFLLRLRCVFLFRIVFRVVFFLCRVLGLFVSFGIITFCVVGVFIQIGICKIALGSLSFLLVLLVILVGLLRSLVILDLNSVDYGACLLVGL
jgi:hypothetical protein